MFLRSHQKKTPAQIPSEEEGSSKLQVNLNKPPSQPQEKNHEELNVYAGRLFPPPIYRTPDPGQPPHQGVGCNSAEENS